MTTSPTLVVETRPRVLFVGDDASSPSIAAGLLRRVAGGQILVETAGTHHVEPGGRSDEMLVAMGLDPAEEHPLSTRSLHTADLVLILGTGLDVARLPGLRYEEWDLAADDLPARVEALSAELLTAGAPPASVRDRLRRLLGAVRRG